MNIQVTYLLIPIKELAQFKILIGMFHEEMKSNNITDLVVWLDCKSEYNKKRDTEISFKRNYEKYNPNQ